MGDFLTQTPDREAWIHEHANDIEQVYRLACESPSKAVFIEGEARTGKTTLARYATMLAEENYKADIYFTTPQVQNTLGAKSTYDRSGLEFKKLPSPKEMANKDNLQLVVVDEIAQRKPESSGGWSQYVGLENVKFILLTHPNNPNLGDWKSLFSKSSTTVNLYGVRKSLGD